MTDPPIIVGLSVTLALLVFLLILLGYLGRDEFRRRFSFNRSGASYHFRLPSLKKKKRIIIGLFGTPETIKQWLLLRGYRIGEYLTINGIKVELREDPAANDPDVAGGIGLHDATQNMKEKWRTTRKPVAFQTEDPHVSGKLPLRWTMSYAHPINDLLKEMEHFTPDWMA